MGKAMTIALCAAAMATAVCAVTITWTGDYDGTTWNEGANWDLQRTPEAADDVVVDGAAVNANGNLVISSLTLSNGATVVCNGELKSEGDATSPVYSGGKVSCSLVALINGPVTISDAEIANAGTAHNNGFYRGTGYLNFVDGSERAAKYTFQSSLGATPFATFFSGADPLIRYNGQAIDEFTYNANFTATDNGDGTTTLSLKTLSGWSVAAPTLGAVSDGQVSVDWTATRYSGGNATVSIGCATSDLGDDMADWAGNLTQVATGVSVTTTSSETITLAAGFNYIRVFVSYDGTTTASPAATARYIVYGDYGQLTGVYEYIGTDGDLAKAANWALDKTPLGENDAAPVGGTDIRWFGGNAVLSVGNFPLYSTDHFVGATITPPGAGNYDSNLNGDVVFENSSITLSTVVVQAVPHSISLKNSHFTTTRTPDGVAGFYPAVPDGGVNFISGFASSYTFGADSGDANASTAKALLVDTGKITLDGTAIDAATWTDYFSIDEDGTAVTVSYNPVVAANRVDSVSVAATSSAATFTATLGTREAGTLVKLAYGTTAPTEADVLAGTAMTADGLTATASVSGLTDLTAYHYLVAIVDAGSTEVLASKAGVFVASNYAYVYMNGAWLGDAPNLGSDDSVLFLSPYSAGTDNFNVTAKVLRNASITTGTLTGSGTMQVFSSKVANDKKGDNGAEYGIWNCATPMNFMSMSAGGVVYQACSYTFYATGEWKDGYVANLLANGKIKLNGETVSDTSAFVISENADKANETTTPINLTLTWWEPFPTDASGAWTLLDGARVRLAGNAKVGALAVEPGADAKIDLNGHTLKVSSLTVNGVSLKGAYTAESLPSLLVGNGSLTIGASPTIISVR